MWASLLDLRTKLKVDCAQSIFDTIETDKSVLEGLAAARLFYDAVIKQGQVPNELLLKLNQGPAKHVKSRAYNYRKKIDLEIARIGRITDLQNRAVGLAATGIVATAIATGNVLGQLYLSVLQSGNSTLALIIAGVAIGTVLLLCIVFVVCMRYMRRKRD